MKSRLTVANAIVSSAAFAACCFAAVLDGPAARAQSSAALRAQLTRYYAAMDNGFNHKNFDEAFAPAAPNCIITIANGRRFTVSQIENLYTKLSRNSSFRSKTTVLNVRLLPNGEAVVLGKNTTSISRLDPNTGVTQTTSRSGDGRDVWKQTSYGWRMISSTSLD